MQVVSGPHLLHPPLPLHVPRLPQGSLLEVGQLFSLSATPSATLPQTPTLPWRLQARHVPVQASSQQTPSLQKPLSQSLGAAHVAPKPFVPQVPLTHVLGALHSVLPTQESKHAVPAPLH